MLWMFYVWLGSVLQAGYRSGGGSVRMAAAQLDVDGILVVDDAADARHRRVDESLAVAQSPSVLTSR